MADLEARSPRPLLMICAMLANKDANGLLRPFSGLAREVICIPVPGDSASHQPEALAALARSHGLSASAAQGVTEALRALAARGWPVPPRILIAGSLYLAGDVLRENGTIPD